ncbi:protein ROS1 isoform X2 [Arachis ipaensis]|uniref:protein ROS1 isoform X2 n=1 Tax=Arachis ipaensis TaxID=130454 RepID=UPI000A2B78E3|nr:protein ROS1 isoform X2 [Arachis ipaensis]
MDNREMNNQKEQQVETRWAPTTPMKPTSQKTVPIYAPEQENHPQIPTHGDGAIACSKFTASMEKNKRSCIGSVTEGGMKNTVGENSEACVKTVSGDFPALGHMSFSQLMATMQENAASANLNATQSDNGSMNPDFFSLDSQINYNRAAVNNTGNLQDTSLVGCSQIASLSMNMEKNNPVGEFDVACTPIKMDAIQVESTPQSKQKRRKHRPKVIVEGTPKRTRKSAEEKNVQLKENSTGKRKYVRRKGINKTATTPAEETIKDFTPESTKKSCKRTLFDGSAGTENATAEGTAASYNKEAQDPSQSNPPVAQPMEKTTKKRGRKKKTPNMSYPTEATVEFSEALIPRPNTRSRSNKKSKEESSTSGDFYILLPVDTQIQNTSAERMRYSRTNATNKVSYDHEPIVKTSSIFSPESTSQEIKPIVNYSFEDNKNKRDQTTENEESLNTSGRNIIGVHHNDLFLFGTKIDRTNRNEVEMTFSPQDARRLDYASSSDNSKYNQTDNSEYNSDYDKFDKFISRVRNWEEQTSEDAVDKSLDNSDVDAITKQFKKLKIKTQENAIIRYKLKKQKQKQKRLDGAIIPFGSQVVPFKKQYPRARVNLDEETNRVWKLLMLDINSHGIDGEDEATSKRWEEERNLFRGKADSFIARMHRVQGDRRFSRWKGSVVDSVVGVFLTQNVSDHLSSSAFMALAARFPNKSQVNVGAPVEISEGDAPLNPSVHDATEHSGHKITHCSVQEMPQRTGFNDMVASRSSGVSQTGEVSNEQNDEKMGSYSEGHSDNINRQAENSTKVQEEADTKRNEATEKLTSGDLKNDSPKENNTQVPLKASIFPTQESVRSSENEKSMPCCPDNGAEMSQRAHSERIVAPAQAEAGAHKSAARNEAQETSSAKKDSKGKGKEHKDEFNWDSLRTAAQAIAGKREKTWNTMDSLDWDAVRCADVSTISDAIKERGMNNRLAERIQLFLNRLVEDHGDIDLEWLRDVPPDKAKEFLLSIKGLGLKSVECVRLLTLHHLAFPVDTNVGRIAVRLGWVPLQPLPETLQLHLLELYPILETVQKYLWPRLCKLDQKTLYELHYQMITFGKVFCTKHKPNCNACPMKGECRHFASAFASARLALPGPEQTSIVSTSGNNPTDQNPTDQNPMDQNPAVNIAQLHLPLLENPNQGAEILQAEVAKQLESIDEKNICHPIIEEPTTPEAECSQVPIHDIEDAFWEPREIPPIDLDLEEFTLNLKNYMQGNMELQEAEMSRALVALTPETANIPMPRLKYVNRLRTEHCVYELPDTHPLLEGWDKREADDPGKYLLAIWTPGETANSIQPPERKCSYQESGQLCNEKECLSCNSVRESDSQTVRGTILIPCRTAMRGSFPLNGTYFQVNEVFADHESSKNPISVPRSWIWNLNRRTVYFGTSVTSIFKGLTTPEIQQCFWRGYVCVRGFDRATRAPRPLKARLHFPASKMAEATGTTRKKSTATKSEGAKTNPQQPEVVSGSQNLQEGGKPKENPSLSIS